MPCLGKRGFAKNQLAEIILAVVVMLAVIGPVVNINNVALASTNVEKCRLSVVMASLKTTYGFLFWDIGPDNPFYIDCPKRYAYVSNDNIKADNVNTELAAKDGNAEERERQLKDFVLGEMTKCWRSFGDASDKVYTASPGQGEGSVEPEGDETACFACSEIFFDKDFEATQISNFYDYADSRSYSEFLTGGTKVDDIPEDKSIAIGPGQWSSVFVITKIDNSGWFDHLKWLGPVGSIGRTAGRIVKGGNLPRIGSAIENCWMTSVNSDGTFDLVKLEGPASGCGEGGINGFVFGKVVAGYDKITFSPKDLLTGELINSFNKDVARFAMTVRFVPTEDVFAKDQCKRLY